MKTYYSIEDLKRDYEYTSQGHWFDASTMRFFNTRLTSHFKKLSDAEYLFVTTEKGPDNVRKASLRLCVVSLDKNKHCGYTMNIKTVGDFNSLSLAQAKKELNAYG